MTELTLEPDRAEVVRLIRTALDEDLRYGPDVTSAATVPDGATTVARVVSREHGVLAGIPAAEWVLDEVVGPGNYRVPSKIADGTVIGPGDVALTIEAPTSALLTAERTMLNLLTHLSGIATATAAWVAEVEDTDAKIRDSRKTLPGLRVLQKYAVRAGGGVNHRMGLGDAALIKDNHVAAAGSVTAAVEAVRRRSPGIPLEVEVDTLEQLDEALSLGVDLVLLDNMPLWMTQAAVQRRKKDGPRTRLESSGGLTLDMARDYARTGVDYLAVGALTHSVRALDLGLDV
ncbi:nicotinate-nucleotide diphosphorylase (carboxylating) OS=Tsukamurella paurometabola (strain ATCC 8368/ DSM / CCUG 35730 / CIP 100753 / JCM 10117 / KCTC 9821 / NBRC 16120 / NCIMB 702349 / NCTC 13040) OX=521096 GN=Tpau_2012 PE=3 SV=1 [Tsukamurella paurometabola]|uniref:Nicotinate-nucleotide pyrophosphorylase [carboxylating] n=1 Tax=Tsukamurella paurometabola (strain ATCC 8368 / DSM 20162 / CCUG 35730 / CIP 100753 / JCM 10117 / KCTC 9821 / NBRC 16120 / NCIMB 702349 / NCTC 13040) TaxID=521096 RepID=D5UNQ6_TSUPD|nr:carboxylating nicotinate-nucleotide diphosphorylase [Tsukamurella paurometabola]ADG78624.1 nicotinate-nucleotide pyrophosphorylase [Tsukamurella paurometabola DSM 20162]SUP32469.1 Nicotinate-nucleotide pyrophosphorylase [carboxylating] [Tsukamurella paurometabola]